MHDVFYFTDVHGQLDLFQTMRDWCYKQDPEATIVFGGDACDRVEFGFDIMQAILDDPQMIYIRGNHEDMFIRAARELLANNPADKNRTHTIQEANDLIDRESWLHWMNLCLRNGGRPTLKAWLIDGASTEFVDRLEARTCITLAADNGLCFSHAGGLQEAFQRVNECEYNGEIPDRDDEEMMIWDRNYFCSWWDDPKSTIIFGHTPTCYMRDWLPDLPYMRENDMKPVVYTDKGGGTHIAMDTGMTWTGRGYVLNCLTMHVYGFLDPDVKKLDGKRPVTQFEDYKII